MLKPILVLAECLQTEPKQQPTGETPVSDIERVPSASGERQEKMLVLNKVRLRTSWWYCTSVLFQQKCWAGHCLVVENTVLAYVNKYTAMSRWHVSTEMPKICWRYFKIVLHMQSLSIGERQRFELSGLGRSSVTMCVLSGTLCVSVVRPCTHIRFSVRLCQIHYQPSLQQSENANVVLLS